MQRRNATPRLVRGLVLGMMAAAGLAAAPQQAYAQATPPKLNENCIVSVLNRNVRVRPDGSWVLPNIPANFGLVRARATCVFNGADGLGRVGAVPDRSPTARSTCRRSCSGRRRRFRSR